MSLALLTLCGASFAATVGSRFDPDDFAPLRTLDSDGIDRITFNTTTLSVTTSLWGIFDGWSATGVTAQTTTGIEVAVFCFNDVSFTGFNNITITGSRPIVILSRNNIILNESISIDGGNASSSTGGTGVLFGSNGGNRNLAGAGLGSGGRKNNEGGAGAGYGGMGGQGATNNQNGRATYGSPDLVYLYGGSGGGGGGSTSSSTGAGGGGGGAIELSANNTIWIQSDGSISAEGGSGSYAGSYPGGGGSGGSILLNAPTVTNEGNLSVRGGNGGTTVLGEGGGGGGGGRIAIYANTLTQGDINTDGGDGGSSLTRSGSPGNAGSLFSDFFDQPPTILSITRLDASPTNAAAVRFRITFSEPVQTVAPSDFQLAVSGISGASVTDITNTGAVRDVTVNTGAGEGTVRLDFIDLDTVLDMGGYPVGGVGRTDFTTGQVYNIDRIAPTIAVAPPTPSLTKAGPVSYTVTYTGASSVTLAAANITLVPTGGATGTIEVSGTGNTTRTVTIRNIGGTGTLGISIAAGTAVDAVGNAAPSASGDAFAVDNTAPTISVSAPSPALTSTGPVSYTITYGGADNVTLVAGNVTLVPTGGATGAVEVSGIGNVTRTVTIRNITGTGTLGISIAAGTASDTAGNTAPSAASTTSVNVDNSPPTIAIGAPSPALTRTADVTFPITYVGASSVTLAPANVTFSPTGSTTGTVVIEGSGAAGRTVRITNIAGTGTFTISIMAGTATDAAGNAAAAAGPSQVVTVDNTAPTLSIDTPSAAATRTGPVTYTLNYGGANSISLISTQVTLNATDTATGTVEVSGTGNLTRTVTIRNITGNGTLGISIPSGTASDSAGNVAPAAGPSATFAVDNIAPGISISNPSATITASGPVTYTISYTGASAVTLAQANISLVPTGDADGDISVSGSGADERTVTISNITGDGKLGINIAEGTASDAAGNTAPAAGPSTTFDVSNAALSVSIGSASPAVTCTGPVEFTVNYANAQSISLDESDVTVNATGAAYTSVQVLGNGPTSRTVRISGITGDGQLGITIAAGTALDAFSRPAPAAGPSSTCTVDNTAPTMTINAPSASITRTGPVTYTVTYTGASSITLAPANITLNRVGTNATVAVSNTGPSERTVTLSNISGNGTLGFTIAAGTAGDQAGNTAAGGTSATFTVDTAPPTLAITGPSPTITNVGPVVYTVTYTGADNVTLASGDVTLTRTGSANAGLISISGAGATTRYVTLSNLIGDGTIRINIAAGTATDTAGNSAASAGPSSPATVDNTGVTLNIGAPSATLTRNGPITYTLTYGGASSVSLTPGNINLIMSGTADATIGVSGSDNVTRVVTLSNITGDGTLAIGVAPGTGSDAAGNLAPAAGPSAPFTVDNTPPTMEVTGPSPEVACGGSNITYHIKYTDAQPLVLNEGHVTLHTTDTVTAEVEVHAASNDNHIVQLRNIQGSGTVTFSIAAGSAVDGAGNETPAWGPAPSIALVDMIAPTVTVAPPSSPITSVGPVTYNVMYTDAEQIDLAPEDITLNTTGTANGVVSVSGEGNEQRTITISNIIGDGTISIYIAGETAIDDTCNVTLPSADSTPFTVDNTAPTVSINPPSRSLTNDDDVTFAVAYHGADYVTLAPENISLVTTGDANGTVSVSGTSTTARTVRVSNITGDGTIAIAIAAGTASDTAGNLAPLAGPSASFTVDNTPPAFVIGPPSSSSTSGGPVTFDVTYTDADSILLTQDLVTLNVTGGASGAVTVFGNTPGVRTVQISGITGNGSLGISIAASSASDAAGNFALASEPSATFDVDNTSPTIAIGAPSVSSANAGPVSYTVTYSGAENVTLNESDIALAVTGSANATVAVSGTGHTSRTVTLSGITGDGSLGFSIAEGTATDSVGNIAAAAGPSGTFAVDNTGPKVTIGAPSIFITRGGPVTFAVSYTDASAVTLTNADVHVETTGTAAGDAVVFGAGTVTRLVTVSNITGDGTIGISLAAGTATDAVGNAAAAAGPDATCEVDNTPPTVSIGAPSAMLTAFGPVTFTVTYGGAQNISLDASDITLKTSGTASGDVSVSGSGSEQRIVSVSNINGNGNLGIAIAAGTAVDAAGNPAPKPEASARCQVSNAELTVSIGAPSIGLTRNGPVEFQVYYANAHTVTLQKSDITVNTTGSASAFDMTISGSGTASRTVRLSGLAGDGTLGIAIAGNTAQDQYGRQAPGAGPSAVVVVDNTRPSLQIGPPSVAATSAGPISYDVVYTGADSIDLAADDVTLIKSGTANGVVSVSSRGPNTRVVTISGISGKGTLAISIAAGTATDAAGNEARETGRSGSVTIDDGRPTVTIGQPSKSVTRHGPVSFVVDYHDAASITLTPADIELHTTGTAAGAVSVQGGGFVTRVVTISNISGNGSITFAIAPGTAVSSVGNPALGSVPSATVIVDNIPPAITIAGENPVDLEFSLPYVDAGAMATDNTDGDISSRIVANDYVVPWVEGTYSVVYSVADTAGNQSSPVTRTVVVTRKPEDNAMLEFLGGTLCRPGICVTIRGNVVFSPRGVLDLTVDRPAQSELPQELFSSLVPGTWFDVKPNYVRAAMLGTVKLYYDDLDDNGIVDGTEFKEENIFVYFINTDTGAINIIEGNIDTVENAITVEIEHLGVFAISGFVEEAPPDNTDTDGDGLSDAVEAQIGTNPNDADTDGDGISDGTEIFMGLDPLTPDANAMPAADTWTLSLLVAALIFTGFLLGRRRIHRSAACKFNVVIRRRYGNMR